MLVGLAGCAREQPDPLPGFPRLILWAWERPENLMFLVPKATGVAFLSATITIAGEGLSYRPRMQPLRVPPATRLVAVVRIESRVPHSIAAEKVAEQVLRGAEWPQVGAVQIDYDALVSERGFYRELLGELRRRIPVGTRLEMTALVSWCTSDDWLRGLPVVDAVPMFFRMGAGPHRATERLTEPLCGSSIGISTDEFYTGIPGGRRVFVFHPRAWTETDYRALLVESAKWQ
jgi:hypothetical protein